MHPDLAAALTHASEFRVLRASDDASWIVEAMCGPAYEKGLVALPSMVVSDHDTLCEALTWAEGQADGRSVYLERV